MEVNQSHHFILRERNSSKRLSDLHIAIEKFHRRTKPLILYPVLCIAIYLSPVLAEGKRGIVKPASMPCPSHHLLISSIFPERTAYVQYGDQNPPFLGRPCSPAATAWEMTTAVANRLLSVGRQSGKRLNSTSLILAIPVVIRGRTRKHPACL